MSDEVCKCNRFYNELRRDRELFDALIRVDGVEFHAHKLVLCGCSPYFRSLFTHWSTPHSHVYEIPNVSPAMMQIIIDFAYTGFVPLTKDNIQEIFIAADQFNVKGIMQACTDLLVKQLAPNNCISVWWFTDTFYNPELKHRVLAFLLQHFEEVAASSQEFLQLSGQELVRFVQNDQLNVREEKTVFEAIVRWIKHAPGERAQYLSELLSKVRLGLMSPECIMETVINNELVKASDQFRQIVRGMKAIIAHRTKVPSLGGNPLARPRLPNSILFAIGGWSSDGATNSIDAYDVRANRWVNVPYPEENLRAYLGTAFLEGFIYCIGGFDSLEKFSSMSRFDPVTHTWKEVAPMHACRCYVSITVMDGLIYALGGFNGERRLETAERYQPSTNQWTLIAPMHEQRSDASCTTYRGKIYICGGFDGSHCLSTAEKYNPETNQWTLIAPMSFRRSGLGVVSFADHIVVVGGFDGDHRLCTAEYYNPDNNTWHDMPAMLNPRSNFGIAVIDNHLYVAGGYNGFDTTNDVEAYDINSGEWSDVKDMAIPRSALSCCVVYGLPNMAEYAAPRCPLSSSDEEDEVE